VLSGEATNANFIVNFWFDQNAVRIQTNRRQGEHSYYHYTTHALIYNLALTKKKKPRFCFALKGQTAKSQNGNNIIFTFLTPSGICDEGVGK
jgi:hypothetical protein